jgi:DNA gyrase subunit B
LKRTRSKEWPPEPPVAVSFTPGNDIVTLKNAHEDARLSALMKELCEKTSANGDTGAVTYLGVFASGGRQSNWVSHEVSTNRLLGLIESDMASKVLACVGSSDRLRMLLALLRGPCTVSHLVEACGFSSTGQAYHHLKFLLAADLVEEDGRERGVYIVRPHRVQGIIMTLAGVCDMLDAQEHT